MYYRYKEDGYNKGVPEFTPPPPVRLQWDLNPKCIAAIEESNQVIDMKLKTSFYMHIYSYFLSKFKIINKSMTKILTYI